MSSVRTFPLLTVALALGGCTGAPPSAAAIDTTAARAAIDSVWSAFESGMKAGDTAAIARHLADDVIFAENGWPTSKGRARMLEGAVGLFACCRYLETHATFELTEFAGDRALQFGTYRDVIQPAGQPPVANSGRVSAVLARDSAGAWRISRVYVLRDTSEVLKP